MSMLQHSTRAWGSPSRYIQGRYELENMKTHTEVYGRRVFFLIDVFFFADYKKRFEALYAGSDSQIQCEQFGGQCTEEEILRCTGLAKALNPDVVVGIGGGKTMDTAKAVADNYNTAVIIVPTTASTDAPAMGLSVIYTAAGEHVAPATTRRTPIWCCWTPTFWPRRHPLPGGRHGRRPVHLPGVPGQRAVRLPQLRQQRLSPDHRLHRRVQGVPRDHPDQGRQRQAGRRAGPVHQGRGGRHRGQHPAVRPGRAERLLRGRSLHRRGHHRPGACAKLLHGEVVPSASVVQLIVRRPARGA